MDCPISAWLVLDLAPRMRGGYAKTPRFGIDNGGRQTASSTNSIVISTGLSPRISRPSARPPR